MDVENATLDTAESIISDILISESCVENLISRLDSYEMPTSEKKCDQPQPLLMSVPLQKPDQPMCQYKEPVDQTPPFSRCSVKVVEDYSLNTSQGTDETSPPEDCNSFQESCVENLISRLDSYEMPTSEKKCDQPQPLPMSVPLQKPDQAMCQDKEPVDQTPPFSRCSVKVVEDYALNPSQATCETSPPEDCNSFQESCVENLISRLDSYEMPMSEKKCDQPQPLPMSVPLQKPDQPMCQDKEPVDQTPPFSRCSVKVVEDYSLNPSQDSLKSTLPPTVSPQQSSSGFPLSLVDAIKKDFPVSGDRIRKPLNYQQPVNKAPEPSLMKQIKVIHNYLNLSLKNTNVLNQADRILLSNAKQLLLSLKQRHAVLCDSLKANYKQQIPSDKSRQALKKRINLLQKRQHKLLLLFQEHNIITKKVKMANVDQSKETQMEVKRQCLPSSQVSDNPLLLQTKTDRISNKIITAFDDTQSESASTVYSLGSFAWSQKMKPRSPNLLVCGPKLNTLGSLAWSQKMKPRSPNLLVCEPKLNTLGSLAWSQKMKPRSPNLLVCEPKLNTLKGVKDQDCSALSQTQEPTYESSKIPYEQIQKPTYESSKIPYEQIQKPTYESSKILYEQINHSINNFSDDSHVVIDSEPIQACFHNAPSQTPLLNNESSICPGWLNENSTNTPNALSLKPLPKMLTDCQQFTAIPIGTTADFAKAISHTQQSSDNQLVPNPFPSVVISARQGLQNSGTASQESQNIPVCSRDDLLCTLINISSTTANRAGSLKLCEMEESQKEISVIKSKNDSTDENNLECWSNKGEANLDDTSSQIATSLTHLTLIEDQELMPLYCILPSCKNTDPFGSINFPKFLWDGFHKWP